MFFICWINQCSESLWNACTFLQIENWETLIFLTVLLSFSFNFFSWLKSTLNDHKSNLQLEETGSNLTQPREQGLSMCRATCAAAYDPTGQTGRCPLHVFLNFLKFLSIQIDQLPVRNLVTKD